MVIRVEEETAAIVWKDGSAPRAGVFAGTDYALVHCTLGANLSAGNTQPAGKINAGPAMVMEASVFVSAAETDFHVGDHEFGMVQVTELYAYKFLYAGRVTTEGAVWLDVLKGFTRNPSLDVDPPRGMSIDDDIFDLGALDVVRVRTPRPGFQIKFTYGDHPNNAVPLRFSNTLTAADNYLAQIHRHQHFKVFFVTRASASAPVRILGRFGWAVQWAADVNWPGGAPTVQVTRSELFPGRFMRGGHDDDPWAPIAVNRTEPTTNAQDEAAVDRIYNDRRMPLCTQLARWPDGFRRGFFT